MPDEGMRRKYGGNEGGERILAPIVFVHCNFSVPKQHLISLMAEVYNHVILRIIFISYLFP